MKKVMIIDNDEEFLYEVDELLKAAGYSTIPLSEGRGVVKNACLSRPDVILLDLKMNESSGFSIADELSRNPKTENIPIIAITGVYTEKSHLLLMREVGIKECIIKPINPDEMLGLIKKLM